MGKLVKPFRLATTALCALGVGASITCTAQNANLVQNGDFEAPDAGNDYVVYGVNQTFGGWVVEQGTVDLSGPRWAAATGKQSVDLTGSPGQGAIYQQLSTQPGQTYRLRFAIAGNPECEQGIKRVEVWWGEQLLDTLTFDTRGRSNDAMGWQYREYTVTAFTHQTRLRFRSRSNNYCGPMIDSVSVTPVDGVKEFVEQDVLVVIYTRTNGGIINEADIPLIQASANDAKAFYQRNTFSRLNLNYSFLVIRDYRAIVGEYGTIAPWDVEPDLRARGIRDDQYDGVIVVAPGSGAYMWGTWILRSAGYCQSGWFGRRDMPWFIVHEYGHVLDWQFEALGFPNYPSNHPGENRELIGVCGPDWDVNADICRRWAHWLEMGQRGNSRWGRLAFTRDADGDGVPDDDPRFMLDEARFNSSSSAPDSDSDGLNDMGELTAGLFAGSNPINPDTDGDGVADGADPYPLYPLTPFAPFRRLNIDAPLASRTLLGSYFHSNPAYPVALYVNWDLNHLHIAIRTPFVSPRPLRLYLHTDNDNDGLFHGTDNYRLTLNSMTQRLELQEMFDANVSPPHDHHVYAINEPIQTRFTLDGSQTTYRIAIPRNAAYGLELRPWEQIGVWLVFDHWGQMIEPTVYFRFTLTPLPGDVDHNGCVDDADLLAVLFAFGRTGASPPEDMNRDGRVDDADLLLVLFNFGRGC